MRTIWKVKFAVTIMILITVALGLASATTMAQSPGSIDRAFANLSSPYAGERDAAVNELGRLLKTPHPLLQRLPSKSADLRTGAARTLGQHFQGKAVVSALLRAWDQETDAFVRSSLATAIMSCAFRSGLESEAILRSQFRKALTPAACSFVRAKIQDLSLGGVRWTNHRKLGRFASLGPYAAPALIPILTAEGAKSSTPARCLAAMVFGRLDAPAFWGVGGGQKIAKAPAWRILDGDDNEHPSDFKMALLYAAALQGPDSPELIRRVARFVREDAFSGHLIEAGLYYLYTLPGGAEKGAEEPLRSCAREFLGYGYTDRELYNAAHLLRRLPSKKLIREAAAQLAEHDLSFARYFYFCAAVDNLGELPEGERGKLREKLYEWGLKEDRSPQTRLATAWYWRRDKGELPPSIDLKKLKEDVRESVRKVQGQQDDADFYAQRAGLLVLPLFPDDQLAALVGRMLKHSSEAVRMLAARAASDAKLTSLTDRLLAIAQTDCEYAAFGAAAALATMKNRNAIKPLLEIIASGNRSLAPGALAALRKLIGEPTSTRQPRSKAGWRILAASLAGLAPQSLSPPR
ncbi:MAG: HEAT repeat domain-containing protein [Planctomycetota bacterium]